MARKPSSRRRRSRMHGGSHMLSGTPISGGVTSGQQYGVNAVATQRGGADELPGQDIQAGGSYHMIVPAALVLANNVMGSGRSLRYKGKGGLSRGSSSSYSRRRKGSRRR